MMIGKLILIRMVVVSFVGLETGLGLKTGLETVFVVSVSTLSGLCRGLEDRTVLGSRPTNLKKLIDINFILIQLI